MASGAAKVALFDAFASVAQALGSGRRAEIVDLLAQGERSVEEIATEISQSVANTSQHLRLLARKGLVRSRRDGKLRGEDSELFSGAFWSGRQALALGLIDGIGHMRDILRARFGDRTEFKLIAKPQGWGLRRLGFGTAMDPASGLIDAMEIRALWGRFGL